MKIYHYQRRDRQPNFGDALNQWLWPRLLPDFFDGDDSTLFVGTGTLLNHRLPERVARAKRVIVFSSGVGYERPLKQIPDHWQILCVRGPLSAKALGLPREKAITDGGILVNRCFYPTAHRTHAYGFMPHIHHANFAQAAWQQICKTADVRYIDPRWPIEQVLTAISEVNVLLAEAMHGAIVADALRTPWIPIVTSPRILRFKWLDWCASIGVAYRPQYLSALEAYPRYARGVRSASRALRHEVNVIWQTHCFETGEIQRAVERMQTVINSPPCLSKDGILRRLNTVLEEQLATVAERADRL